MIAVDTNILIYAHRADSQWNERAFAILGQLALSGSRWAIPWPCVHEFLAVVTNPRVFRDPTPTAAALEQIRDWLTAGHVLALAEGPGYLSAFEAIASSAHVAGGLVHDARVAALCVYHGVSELWTADRDFGRFPALKTRNPLIEA